MHATRRDPCLGCGVFLAVDLAQEPLPGELAERCLRVAQPLLLAQHPVFGLRSAVGAKDPHSVAVFRVAPYPQPLNARGAYGTEETGWDLCTRRFWHGVSSAR